MRHELTVARSGTRIASKRLGARLRALYEQGDVEPLEIVFGATSLDEALTSLDSLTRASSQGEDVLRELKAARIRLTRPRPASRREPLPLPPPCARPQARRARSQQTRASRSAYIASLAAKRRLTQQQLSALIATARAADARTAAIVETPVRAPTADVAAAPQVVDRRPHDHGQRDRLLAGRNDRDRPAGRLGCRCGRSQRDPAWHPHDRAGVRRSGRC